MKVLISLFKKITTKNLWWMSHLRSPRICALIFPRKQLKAGTRFETIALEKLKGVSIAEILVGNRRLWRKRQAELMRASLHWNEYTECCKQLQVSCKNSNSSHSLYRKCRSYLLILSSSILSLIHFFPYCLEPILTTFIQRLMWNVQTA